MTHFDSLHWLTGKATATFPVELHSAVNRFLVAAFLAGADGARITIKDIASIASGYRSELEAAVEQVYRGRSTAVALVDRMGSLIAEYAERIFREGFEDGGADFEEMTAEERAALDDWRNTQLDHMRAFAEAVEAAQDVPAREAIARRVDMWVDSLRSLGDIGKSLALSNMSVTWEFGDTIHCPTCEHLNGQRHRLKWFTSRDYYPRKNGAAMDCHGFNCQCRLLNDKGEQILPA